MIKSRFLQVFNLSVFRFVIDARVLETAARRRPMESEKSGGEHEGLVLDIEFTKRSTQLTREHFRELSNDWKKAKRYHPRKSYTLYRQLRAPTYLLPERGIRAGATGDGEARFREHAPQCDLQRYASEESDHLCRFFRASRTRVYEAPWQPKTRFTNESSVLRQAATDIHAARTPVIFVFRNEKNDSKGQEARDTTRRITSLGPIAENGRNPSTLRPRVGKRFRSPVRSSEYFAESVLRKRRTCKEANDNQCYATACACAYSGQSHRPMHGLPRTNP